VRRTDASRVGESEILGTRKAASVQTQPFMFTLSSGVFGWFSVS